MRLLPTLLLFFSGFGFAQSSIGLRPLPSHWSDLVVELTQEDACPSLSGVYETVGDGTISQVVGGVELAEEESRGMFNAPLPRDKEAPIDPPKKILRPSSINVHQDSNSITVARSDKMGVAFLTQRFVRGIDYTCKHGYLIFAPEDSYLGGGEHGLGYKAGTLQRIYSKSKKDGLIGIEHTNEIPRYFFGLIKGKPQSYLRVWEEAPIHE